MDIPDVRRDGIIVYKQPVLKEPLLIAAWPGISNVALRAACYLCEELGAEEFAEVSPAGFFESKGVIIENNLIQTPKLPRNRLYFWRHPRHLRDVILFIGEAQPVANCHGFADTLIDFTRKLGVSTVLTFAAAMINEHKEKSKVWAAATRTELLSKLESLGVTFGGDFYVAGMNGVLLSAARDQNLDGICLLGETPRYASQLENPAASMAILEVLTTYMSIDIDFSKLEEMKREMKRELQKFIHDSQNQYISDFTVPLWEKQADDEEKS